MAILALQAAVATESGRLVAGERERGVIRAELHDARLRLTERGGQPRELIERPEAERDHVAHELREESAQTLAAVLLGLGALERELGFGPATPRLGELQTDIGSTLRALRSLAASLRPPLELGLDPALEGLAGPDRGSHFAELRIALPERGTLSAEVETIIYPVAEEALEAAGGARLFSGPSAGGYKSARDRREGRSPRDQLGTASSSEGTSRTGRRQPVLDGQDPTCPHPNEMRRVAGDTNRYSADGARLLTGGVAGKLLT